MSDGTAAPIPVRKSRTNLILAVLSALILLLIYGAGFIVLPVTIMSSFQGKDCENVRLLHKVYTGLYPGFMQDGTLPASVNECRSYLTASSYEEAVDWRAAYDAYQAYSSTYPDGLFAAQAHENGALALMNLVKEQIPGEQYKEALDGLDRIVSEFADTGISAEAWTMIPSTYASWGSDLQDEGQFEQAEQAFYRFKIWSQNNQKPDLEKDAQRELAQLYVAWGLNLQSQKQYEIALAKFDQAIAADPQSEFASTGQAEAGKRSVYVEWGNELLEQDRIPEALEKFGNAISLADGEEDNGARDALANGYLHWASDLRAEEDFRGALDKMDMAENTAGSDEMKRLLETALGEIYLAFSNSTGRQAQQVIKETLEIVCKKNNTPALPIFSLNQNWIRVGLYGIVDKLPEDLAARTPGEMHYIACVRQEERIIDSESRYSLARFPGGSYVSFFVWQYRIKTFWHISLRNIETGDEYAATTLEGGAPPPFPEKRSEWGEGRFYGEPPSMNKLVEWLQSIIQ